LHRSLPVKLIAPIVGWGLAVLTHSIHNVISTFFQGVSSLTIGLVFDWSGWIAMFIFVIWALYREQNWITTQLRDEVTNGVITLAQYKIASSAWAQTGARLRALFAGQYRRIDHFFELTAELAFKKHQANNLGELEQNQLEIERMRSELDSLSPQISI
ncbi:MAG TPA: hypothetical protein VLD65_12335, partial [Anaerolineales bacterium]|nr:hypothetical protein [Anaerolineales bacterium]